MLEIKFPSEDFPPVLPDECQGNPGTYGFELLYWLAQALMAKGIVTSYPGQEDWGWYIEQSGESEYMIGCSPLDYDGGRLPTEWRLFVRNMTWTGWLKPKRAASSDTGAAVLMTAIVACLAERGITATPTE
ncbi:MAG: hypothetical protein HC841_05225 [Verrucomicrobiae bacterium]|nr:hypothetical protein [Verrucomicrobiae bacterium]